MILSATMKHAVVTDVAPMWPAATLPGRVPWHDKGSPGLARKTASEKGVYLHVLKNSLARRAVAGTPFEVASASMVGPLIYGFSEDAVAAAKVLSDFAKTNDKLIVKASAHAGQALDAKGVQSLASIPSKEVLLSQLLGLMQSPIARIARVLACCRREARRRCSCRSSTCRSRAPRPKRQPTLRLRAGPAPAARLILETNATDI